MVNGHELWKLEAAGRDDHAFIDHPNICIGERVEGRLMPNRPPVVLTSDGRAVRLAHKASDTGPSRRVAATIVEQVGAQPRAYDLEVLDG